VAKAADGTAASGELTVGDESNMLGEVPLTMAIKITNEEAERLIRDFAKMEGVGVSAAVIIAMQEALQVRGEMLESDVLKPCVGDMPRSSRKEARER
jgi:hypothetical protein